VDFWVDTVLLEEHATSIFRVQGSMILRKVSCDYSGIRWKTISDIFSAVRTSNLKIIVFY
jgi:hypothetical protein